MDAFYYDLDKEAKTFTEDKFGLSPEKTIENINHCENKFNYIFSDNVIEHVKKPDEFLRDLINQLEDGGILVIKTPHASNTELLFNPIISIKGYFLKALRYNSLKKAILAWVERYWSCDPPRHLYSFSKNSLKYLMANFDNEDLQYQILYYRTPWFNNTITEQFFSKDKRLSIIKSIVIRLFLLPLIPFEIFLQACKHFFLQIGLLSPGGIILKIKKMPNP